MACSVAMPTSPSPAAFSSPQNPSCRHGTVTTSLSFNHHQVKQKRKRSALLIEIPKDNSRNNNLAINELELRSDGRREVVEQGLGFAVCCKRGRKKLQMEDRYLTMPYFNGETKTALFGVFDGHGGSEAAEFCSKNVGKFIVDELEKREGESFEAKEEAVRNGYLRTDTEFLKGDNNKGGACCLTALFDNCNLVISNAGDCRAVLCKNGKAEALTSDHKLSKLDERERVQKLGGFVQCRRGIWRLQGSLAVSRGIGDMCYKQWVIPEPDTSTIKINYESEFLILASDGLWDKLSSQEAVDIARPFCTGEKSDISLQSACKELTDLSVKRGSLDDITVMIILLQQFATN